MTAIRILIVDDHPVVRDGLRGMFSGDPEFDVVGEASDGAEAIELARRLEPDVILMDLRMPVLNGAAAIRGLAEQKIPSRVLVLTTYDSDSDVVPAIEAGATGYLLKDSPREDLFRAVRAASRGESVLASSVATRLMNQLRDPAPDARTPHLGDRADLHPAGKLKAYKILSSLSLCLSLSLSLVATAASSLLSSPTAILPCDAGA